MLAKFASSTFNKCLHQPAPATKAYPLTLQIERDMEPTAHYTPGTLPARWKYKAREDLDRDEKLGIIEKVPEEIPTTWLYRLVVTAEPNGEPQGATDPYYRNRLDRAKTHTAVPPFIQAWRVQAQTWKTVTETWSHSAPIREEDKDLTTFVTEWGRYRYRSIPNGHVPGNKGHAKRHDRIVESVERQTRVANEVIIWDADHDLETHWRRTYDYLALMGSHGVILDGDRFQFCGKTVDFAGFKVSEQEVTPMQRFLEPISALPPPRSASEARLWHDLVTRTTHHAQAQGKARPPKAPSPSTQHFGWTERTDGSSTESKQRILEAIRCGMEEFDPARATKLCTEHAEEGLGFYLAQKHCGCTKTDPSCCNVGWRITVAGSRALEKAERSYTRLEKNYLSVAWALEQTKCFTLDCLNLMVVGSHEPSGEILDDSARTDTANSRLTQLKERTLPWNFAMYRPSKANSIAECMARHPVAIPEKVDRDSHTEKEGISEVPAVPRNMVHSLIPIDLIRRASEDDKTIQKAIARLKNGLGLGTEIEELWQHRDQLSLRDGILLCDEAPVIPTVLRQAVTEILGAAYRDARAMMDRATNTAFWPNINEDIAVHAKSRQTETQPHPRKRTAASRRNASTKRPLENEEGNEATREPHRDTNRTGFRSKRPKRVPPRKDDPTHTTHTEAVARSQVKKSPPRRDREKAYHSRTTRSPRMVSRRNKKSPRAGVPAAQTASSRPSYRPDSAWGGEGL